jgi:hypothetical protein
MFKLKDIKLNNGITLDKQGNAIQYKSGYQVSAEDLAIIPAYKLRKSQLIEMLQALPVGSCLGVWIDNKKAYIDRSARIGNKRLALKTGKALKQISIWDWKAGEAIAC